MMTKQTEGTLSYDERYGTTWTAPRARVIGGLTELEGGLVRRAADYWTVYADGVETSFDPRSVLIGYTLPNGAGGTFDGRDLEILRSRVDELNERTGPRVGDFVRFADGVTRRVSHLWAWDVRTDGPRPADWVDSAQTSDGGSFYLGDGYVSMSGGLHPGVPLETLTDTGELLSGQCWFFHHDWHRAHNGVNVCVPFRLYSCSLEANR